VESVERGETILGGGCSSGRRNTAARVDATTRRGSYLECVIPNDFLTTTEGGHRITIGRKKIGVSHLLLMS